jgi:hypothetical protein
MINEAGKAIDLKNKRKEKICYLPIRLQKLYISLFVVFYSYTRAQPLLAELHFDLAENFNIKKNKFRIFIKQT